MSEHTTRSHREKDSQRERHSHRDKPRHHRSRSRSPPNDRSKERSEKRRRHEPLLVTETTISNAFFIDRRGDPDNLLYGGNYKGDVPKFYRAGGGRVLGLPISLKTSSARKGHELIRYTDPKHTWRETDKAFKRLTVKPSQPNSTATHSADFIPIDDAVTFEHPSGEEEKVDYRSIDGMVKPQSQEELEEEEGEEGESFDEYVRRQMMEFDKNLEKDPHDVLLWLRFIAFQDEAATGLQTATKQTRQTGGLSRLSLNEVKISIFEKALEQNPGDERLLIPYLRCCAEVWDSVKLLTKWDQILQQYPQLFSIWTEYLNFRQTNFASFTYTQCMSLYEECLAVLQREAIEGIMLYIFFRACLFMKQAGYTEKAYATFQAMIEMSLFQPDEFKRPLRADEDDKQRFERLMERFEIFWESEVDRVGEENAKGWKAFAEAGDIVDVTSSNVNDENEVDISETEGSGYGEWADKEIIRDLRHRVPARTTSQTDDDPYRIILFDDIRSLLFPLTTPETMNHLTYTLFTFLDLPFVPPNTPTTTAFATDTFTHNELARDDWATRFWPPRDGTPRLIAYISGVSMDPERKEGVANPFGFPLRSYPVTMDTLFAKEGAWFRVVSEVDLKNVDVRFARNIFKQLRQVIHDDFLSLYYLAFEASTSYKSGQKLAKQMLKTDRMNLLLWNGYAQMEKAKGNYAEARKVYITALSTFHSFPEAQRVDAPLLYRMFAEMEFEMGRTAAALTILTAMAEETGKIDWADVPDDKDLPVPPPTRLLKARKNLNIETLYISAPVTPYLNEACKVFDRTLDEYVARGVERSIDAEILFMAYPLVNIVLVYRHSVSGYAFRPAVLKTVLDRALSLFPNNTIFLSLFFYNEARTKIENRVRRFLNNALERLICLSCKTQLVRFLDIFKAETNCTRATRAIFIFREPNHLLWVFSLYAELHHHLPYNVNLVRSLFDRALECERSRCSIAIWKLYIELETMQNNLGKAKTLFFRAVRECPWAKDLYLLAFRHIRHEFNSKELDEVFSLILEKELRIRIPVEGFLAGQEDEDALMELRSSDEEDERKKYPHVY
ncbi:NRDE-2, necessary for RNA interference-domain-containing protein [Endogone sp. FLAS-F59071]|nr:NRDE-2, necessary for RNA interference-domain-containing protein [Endogone sp. FLAS-F59071]|eukprot:RUS21226.1 NRDE-2, necessary for RNA interference-domain-containing protein [Endogone sp. FLAS-F59071]